MLAFTPKRTPPRQPSSRTTTNSRAAERRRAEATTSLPPITSEYALDPSRRPCACGGRCPTCLTDRIRVSQPEDASEREAQRIADSVTRATSSEPASATNAGHTARAVRRQPLSQQPSLIDQSPAHVQAAVGADARPLDAQTRTVFESRLGYDLSEVRIHTGANAEQSAQALDAKAYTFGRDIVFGRGHYRPDSHTGRQLLAHELAHVTQAQSSAPIQRNVIYRQPARGGADLAAVEYEIRMLRHMIVLPLPMVARLTQLEQRRMQLLAQGAGAPVAPTMPCGEADKQLNISKWRNKCLTVTQRWRLYKQRVEETWNRESDHGRKLSAVADWGDYVTEEEFNRLDSKRTYRDMYDRYLKFYAGGGQYEDYQRARKAEQDKDKPAAPVQEPATEDFPFSNLRQIDIDRMQDMVRTAFGSPLQPAPTEAVPDVAVSGCHVDPHARGTSGTVCGPRRPDEATRATQKAMQRPAPDFGDYYKEQRAMLDRLNAAHLHWQQTGEFPLSREFSPYEVEKDRIVSVVDRWNAYNRSDPDNLERADFNERFFRSEEEYRAEFQRRHNEYLAAVKACGQSRPSHFKCRDTVMAKYYPGRFALYDAAATRTYRDIQIAMPVLRQGGPVAGFVFHATHEWLGWSTERSAAAANLAAGATNLVAAKVQQVYSNRGAGQTVAPPDRMTPPPTHVAPPPRREATPTPDTPTRPSPVVDPWAGTMERPIDVTQGRAFPSPNPQPPTPSTVTPKDRPMRRPPGGGERAGMTATSKTLTPHKTSTPIVEVLPRGTVPMKDFEPPEPGHYIRRKPPSAETQRQILELAGRTRDGRLRDANTGRALNEGEAVWGHAPNYQFKEMRDMAERLRWTQEEFDRFFEDPRKWQIEYGPTNSGRTFDRVPRQRPVH